jgi:TorA maturation chaperone TorD
MSIDLAREGVYRFLAAALRDPRDDGAALARDGDCGRLAMAASDMLRVDAAEHSGKRGFGELPVDLLTLRPAVEMIKESFDELCNEYDRVFGMVTITESPPYETEFCASSDPFYRSQQMADVAGFYRAFGLEPALDSPERPDYLPLQLEFMAFLLMKKRLAAAAGETAQVEICADAERTFFRDHIAWWVPSFATGLRHRAETGLYATLAQVLAAFLPAERYRMGEDTPTIPVMPKASERNEAQPECEGCPAAV